MRTAAQKTKFIFPRFYLPPVGGPLYWRDETTGVLAGAILVFIAHVANKSNAAPSADQIELIRDYLDYWINAPCWREFESGELLKLREEVKTLKTTEEVHKWLMTALDAGIDPL